MPQDRTTFPFALPARLIDRLPRPARDGRTYVDVRFRGTWEGILVIEDRRRCVGVYVGRRIVEAPLPFTVDELEDVRGASVAHRLLAQLPAGLDPFVVGALVLLVLGPASLGAGASLSAPLALATVPVAVAGTWLLYQARGFPLLRLPLALVGVGLAALGVRLFLRAL